jgi:general secretion pathway protein K
MSLRAAATGQRGFALLIVLWTLGLLALLVAGLAASGRSATQLAGNLRDSAAAEAAADGGVQQAIFQLRRGAWHPNGPVYRTAIGRAMIEIATEDENSRINPNYSSPAMLTALLEAVGADPARAIDLSRTMVDWRTATTMSLAGGLKLDRYRLLNLPYGPPSRPFSSVDEIGQVAGMDDDLLSRLRPYVSVYQAGDAQQTANSSFDRTVQQDAAMIGHTSALLGFTSPDEVVLIRVTAVLADGARFARRAVVRLPAETKPGERGWEILTWN